MDEVKAAAQNGRAEMAKNLSADEIAQAETLASKCIQKHYKNCGYGP